MNFSEFFTLHPPAISLRIGLDASPLQAPGQGLPIAGMADTLIDAIGLQGDIVLIPNHMLVPLYPDAEDNMPKDVMENLLMMVQADYVGLDLPELPLAKAFPRRHRFGGIFRYNGLPKTPRARQNALEVCLPEADQERIAWLLNEAGFEVQHSPDVAGMVVPRVVAMIIAEAELIESQGVASQEDIDLAMRLGTNYPLGPFAWRKLWGVTRIRQIFRALEDEDILRYGMI